MSSDNWQDAFEGILEFIWEIIEHRIETKQIYFSQFETFDYLATSRFQLKIILNLTQNGGIY